MSARTLPAAGMGHLVDGQRRSREQKRAKERLPRARCIADAGWRCSHSERRTGASDETNQHSQRLQAEDAEHAGSTLFIYRLIYAFKHLLSAYCLPGLLCAIATGGRKIKMSTRKKRTVNDFAINVTVRERFAQNAPVIHTLNPRGNTA